MANVEKDLRYYQPRRNNLQLGVSVSEAVRDKRKKFFLLILALPPFAKAHFPNHPGQYAYGVFTEKRYPLYFSKEKHYQAGLVGRIMAELGEDIRRASLIIRDINEIFFDYFYTYIVFEQKKRKKYLIFCTLRYRKSSQVHFIFISF